MACPRRPGDRTTVTAVPLSGIRRAVVVGVTGAMFVVLAGTTYQGVATALERRQLPHPGRLIDVGGHQLHLDCVGEGQPTVVLEAPAMGMSAGWGWIRQDLTARTRVCGYDRSGLGWSEAGDGGYDPSRAIDELHLLLEHAGETRPYVLVGQGLGAALATGYATRYRSDLAALVLIDPPAQDDGLDRSSTTRFAYAWPWLARTGVLRGTRLLSRLADGLPDASSVALGAFLNRPDHLTRAASELSRWDDTVRLGAAIPIDAGLRVLRLEAGDPRRAAGLNDAARAHIVSREISNVVEAVRNTP
jgi:pimeloyl-ACP methyl ester carboxylesterase